MRKPFLVLYDYGQGGVWAYLLADSFEQIRTEFPQLRVYDQPPEWMDRAELDAIRTSMTIDIDSREHPFLSALAKTSQSGQICSTLGDSSFNRTCSADPNLRDAA